MSNISISEPLNTQTTTTTSRQTEKRKQNETKLYSSKSSGNYERSRSVKENIIQAKKEGKLTYTPSQKFFFGLFERKAQYTYQASGRETIAEIRAKFGLKNGALRKCNSYIVDAEWAPEKGKLIYFNEEDIIQ